ncbi:GDSL-type esterase/lipase family protein [Granulicella sp. S190]|uniref:GDSL-type esterase/lipase family protein n=1 Tax=Granulicella sp. S190 TaxID=1747226 RepID=UPI00131D5932|nr:GDSL-type esterase/lipase family protein [Granulicella sp. S190]
MPSNFPTQTLLATATFGVILLGVHYGLDRTKGIDPASTLRPIGQFQFTRASFVPVVRVPIPQVPATLAVPDPFAHGRTAADAANSTLQSEFLIDDNGALDHFYAALRNLSTGPNKRDVRIVHYGDSPTTADLITGDARDLLQERFGNAGPGFILIAKPWAWYGHHGVEVSGDGWKIDTAVGSMREADYGLGGAIFTGPVGATSTIHLSAHDSTSIEVEYLAEPNGGNLEVIADGAPAGTVQTAAETRQNAAASVPLPLGTKKVELHVTGSTVQLFGVAFSRDNPGLTYDSIGLNGASTTVMSRAFNPVTFAVSLAHRNPDLVVINYGTNESSFPAYVEKQYEPELIRAIGRVRSALPNASILIMSPMDRGERSGDQISTMRAIPEIVAIQQRVAQQTGCGFFNTYQAMGGSGTMARWYDRHPAMVGADLIHPSPQGARIIAQLLTGQLLIGYERYMQNHQPSPTLAASPTQPSKPMGVQ